MTYAYVLCNIRTSTTGIQCSIMRTVQKCSIIFINYSSLSLSQLPSLREITQPLKSQLVKPRRKIKPLALVLLQMIQPQLQRVRPLLLTVKIQLLKQWNQIPVKCLSISARQQVGDSALAAYATFIYLYPCFYPFSILVYISEFLIVRLFLTLWMHNDVYLFMCKCVCL